MSLWSELTLPKMVSATVEQNLKIYIEPFGSALDIKTIVTLFESLLNYKHRSPYCNDSFLSER